MTQQRVNLSTNSMELSLSLEASAVQLYKNFQRTEEPQSSLPYSQERSSGPTQPDQSNP